MTGRKTSDIQVGYKLTDIVQVCNALALDSGLCKRRDGNRDFVNALQFRILVGWNYMLFNALGWQSYA